MPEENASKLDESFQKFHQICEQNIDSVQKALKLHAEQPEAFSTDLRNMIIDYSILNTYSSWEKFLEDIFIFYMLGMCSHSGNHNVRYVNPLNCEHAYKMIQSTSSYPDWSRIDIYAKNFFENGKPFNKLSEMQENLNGLRKVRNAIAHSSKDAGIKFQKLVQGKLGSFPSGMTPADFLVAKVGKKKSDPCYYEYYIRFLEDAAEYLVENPADDQ